MITRIPALILWLSIATLVDASDLAREQRLAEQIVDAIFIGEPITLDAQGQKFLGIYTEAETKKPRGSVIILHGRGYHPDWENVAHPLRTGLAEHGWTTLSLQMPVLDKEASFYEYVPLFPEAFPRIEAGIRYLQDQGYQQVVLIAHSCSVHMSMAWLEQADPNIDGYIGIGMGATDYRQPMEHPFHFEKLKLPMLDIYGTNDYNAVLRGGPDRYRRISEAGHPNSRQVMIPGADHYFKEMDDVLVTTIASWLSLISP